MHCHHPPWAAGALSDEGHGKEWGKGGRNRSRIGGVRVGSRDPGTGYGVAEGWGSVWEVLEQVEWDSVHSIWGQSKDVGCGRGQLKVFPDRTKDVGV